MSLPSPNLDDRTFQQLLEDSVVRIKRSCPQWTDLSAGDPGIALLEVFAYLTETMIYRLNRIPEKAYVEFLRLLGVKLLAPAAATVKLQFSVKTPLSRPVEIPRGTRVTIARTAGGTEPPVFTTLEGHTIPPGKTETEKLVLACHADWVEEQAGTATGLPGLRVTAKQPPIIAPLTDHPVLVVGVEAALGEIDERAPAIKFAGKSFRIWQEVDDFTDLGADRHVYIADHTLGLITFAPALYGKEADGRLARQTQALAEVPPAGREIRLWYLHGGGLNGDLAPNTLTVIKSGIEGANVEVTNPEAAIGGSAVESVANALARGPMELHTLHRAVTARDFEAIALRCSGTVARVRAYTKAALWKHAAPGTVEVLLVPAFPRLVEAQGRVTLAQLKERQTNDAREQIQRTLDECRPLGTVCHVNWVKFKTVRVKARVVVHRQENPEIVTQRVLQRLHQTINPLPTAPGSAGWRFGQSLGPFHVYDIILAEPGVKYVEQVRLLIGEVPDRDVSALAADASQPRTWYAAAGERLFRSMNDGVGWEQIHAFLGEKVNAIRVHPELPGHVAMFTRLEGDQPDSRVWLSEDCGESWQNLLKMPQRIEDLAWLIREGRPALLLATDVGLYELEAQPGGALVQIIVDPNNQGCGFYAVAVSAGRKTHSVAVAAQESGGVWLSDENGLSRTYRHIGPPDKDVRVIEAHEEGGQRFLWAGTWVGGDDTGEGCFRWGLTDQVPQWSHYRQGWEGGACNSLAFLGSNVIAATYTGGVLWIDSMADPSQASWEKPNVNCGLPLQQANRFHPIIGVAADPAGRLLLAGGRQGIYASRDGSQSYAPCSKQEFVDEVTLPDTWLFCSGEHQIDTKSDDAPG